MREKPKQKQKDAMNKDELPLEDLDSWPLKELYTYDVELRVFMLELTWMFPSCDLASMAL